MSTTFTPADQTVVLAAATTLTASQSGSVVFLNAVGGFAVTLPSAADGLRFEFIIKTSPTTAYTIEPAAGTEYLIGGINELETDTNDDGPYVNAGDTSDVLTLVANVAVVGDYVTYVSDGTYWYIDGQTNADGGVTIA